MSWRRFGEAGALLDCPSAPAALAWAEALVSAAPAGVVEAVPAARSVLVHLDPEAASCDELTRLPLPPPPRSFGPPRKRVVVAVAFDGEDLEAVGEVSGLGAKGVVAALCRADLRVAFVGFAPGFAYLEGLPAPLARLGRRASPRPAVPAGSLAVAAGYAAIYPSASPGGWQLLGRTASVLFDPFRPPYARLAPGDAVTLEAADPEDVVAPRPPAPLGRPPGPPTFVVEAPGALSTLQDGGRPGLAHLGVPRAGPADPVGHALANRLVGNPSKRAAIEATVTGPTLVARRSAHVAVVGRQPQVTLDGLEAPAGRVLPVEAGQRLEVRSTGRGARAYLAVAGGFEAPAVLGSVATDTLFGLGPPPLAPGAPLWASEPVAPLADHLVVGPARRPPTLLRVLPGPHGDLFGAGHPLAAGRFVVEAASNRVGVRLAPADGPVRRSPGEVPPLPMVAGAVQVPPDGHPIVLLADHATHGGYPVAGVVALADRGDLGQLAPGDEVVFEPIGFEEASTERRALERALAAAVAGRYPGRAG